MVKQMSLVDKYQGQPKVLVVKYQGQLKVLDLQIPVANQRFLIDKDPRQPKAPC